MLTWPGDAASASPVVVGPLSPACRRVPPSAMDSSVCRAACVATGRRASESLRPANGLSAGLRTRKWPSAGQRHVPIEQAT